MEPTSTTITLPTVLQIAETLGALGILALLSWGFWKGEIIPRKVMDRLIEVYRTQTEKTNGKMIGKLDDMLEQQVRSRENMLQYTDELMKNSAESLEELKQIKRELRRANGE